ncbi:hypothetical protein Tco_0126988 [Tanacetum coccineum]
MTRPDPAMTRWLTGGPAVVTVVRDVDGCQAGVLTSLTTVDCAVDRWYEVQTDMSADMSVRGTRWQDTSVRVRGQACMDPCQSLAIMRRLVECKKSIIPLDPAISLDEDLKGRNCPSHLEAINGARISCI